jgi:hypothetical protein
MTENPCIRHVHALAFLCRACRPRFGLVAIGLASWLAAGCASRHAAPPPAAADETAGQPDAGVAEDEPLDLERAEQLIAGVEASWPTNRDDPLWQPKTLDDGMQILKRDQATLFPAGVALARSLVGLEALALEAQLELAWGESYLVVMAVLQRLDEELGRVVKELPAGAGHADREWLDKTIHQNDRYAEALQLLSIAHLTVGSAKADEVMSAHPDSYLGYRLAADYYRTVRDWTRFEAMVARIETLNPKSNGLVFLRGAAAFARDRDVEAASSWFARALDSDRDFLRARAHLVMIQPDLARMMTELAALRAANPQHQLVRFCGPTTDWLESHRSRD